eukprot:NODE_353_length_3133_cov_9.443446.p1 GENE.NODE_353_length_3133_cov_9.443446~~NODE_353_length_3133_cov_9.443446.p1  ORF type:complete len:537 (-),score=89.67 NODE_353_length_3133_cov_9.443446:503-2113(-)
MYQSVHLDNHETFFHVVPVTIVRYDFDFAAALRTGLPEMFADPYFIFDVVVVVLGCLEAIIIWVYQGTYFLRITVLARFVRVVRLLRLARKLLHVSDLDGTRGSKIISKVKFVGDLGTIVDGIASSSMLAWCFLMVYAALYIGALIMVTIIGQDEATYEDTAVHERWFHLGDAMLTLAQINTFSDWRSRVEDVAKGYPWVYLFTLGNIQIVGLGLMNLIVGVMVQAAFRVIEKDKEKQADRNSSKLSRALHSARKNLGSTCHPKHKHHKRIHRPSHLFPGKRPVEEPGGHGRASITMGSATSKIMSVNRFLRPVQSAPAVVAEDDHLQDVDPAECDAVHVDKDAPQEVTLQHLEKLLNDPNLSRDMQLGGIRLEEAIMVFQKLNLTGSINVDDFLEGLRHLRQPLQGVDVADTKSLMRRLFIENTAFSRDVTGFCDSLLSAIEQLRGIHVMQNSELNFEEGGAALADDGVGRHVAKITAENRALEKRIKKARVHLCEARRRIMDDTCARTEQCDIVSEAKKDDDEISLKSVDSGGD